MEEVSDQEIFKVFTTEDCKTREKLNISRCIQLLEEKYGTIFTNEQKDNIKNSLKRYHSTKKLRYTDKHISVNWDELNCLGESSTVVFRLLYQKLGKHQNKHDVDLVA